MNANISFETNDKLIDFDKINNALENAQLKDMIENQPSGIDTIIGENGIRSMSGATKDLIAQQNQLVKGLKEEILEATQMYMAQNAPKAAMAMTGALYDPTELGIRDKMSAAKELLDRVGLVKTEKMQVEASGGVMLMPPKAVVEDDD